MFSPAGHEEGQPGRGVQARGNPPLPLTQWGRVASPSLPLPLGLYRGAPGNNRSPYYPGVSSNLPPHPC